MKPYQRPWLKYPDTCLFQSSVTEQLNPFGDVQRDLENVILHDMRESLAATIVQAKVLKHDGDFHREYRMQIYVFTPDEFHKIVDAEVQRQLDMRPREIMK